MSNLTAPMIPIYLERQDPLQPRLIGRIFLNKGFRLQGGSDYRLLLSIKKVTPNTPAHNRLHQGDVIVAIQGNDATSLTHQQGHDLIRMAGNGLNLMVRKGQYNVIKATRAPVKYTQTGQTIVPAQNAYRRF